MDPEVLLRREGCETVRDADAAGDYRFDASDLMPRAIGAIASDRDRGAFGQGMLDLTDGLKPIEQVLADIEAEWVALEPEGTGT